MKGVVLWVFPDRHPLAGATNTNEAALIRAPKTESTPCPRYAALWASMAASDVERLRRA
ncbi:hypothetical protein SuNHUV7_20800 (plasmid) [Pseudoseohaeicola sp. NH-UV-7]